MVLAHAERREGGRRAGRGGGGGGGGGMCGSSGYHPLCGLRCRSNCIPEAGGELIITPEAGGELRQG